MAEKKPPPPVLAGVPPPLSEDNVLPTEPELDEKVSNDSDKPVAEDGKDAKRDGASGMGNFFVCFRRKTHSVRLATRN